MGAFAGVCGALKMEGQFRSRRKRKRCTIADRRENGSRRFVDTLRTQAHEGMGISKFGDNGAVSVMTYSVAMAVLAPVVFPLERDPVLFQRQQSMVRDGYPVRVASQILQGSLRAAEWRLGIGHPVAVFVRMQQLLEGEGVLKRFDAAGKKEEPGRAGDPALVIRRKTTTGNSSAFLLSSHLARSEFWHLG